MMNLALWLKKNGFKADQVQTFYPSPMATATAMYHTGLNPLKGISRRPKADGARREGGHRARREAPPLHKAFLRWHDPANWPLLREALKAHGPRRPHRQRQAAPDPELPAGHRRQLPERAAQELHARRREDLAGDEGAGADAAHRVAAAPGWRRAGAARGELSEAAVGVAACEMLERDGCWLASRPRKPMLAFPRTSLCASPNGGPAALAARAAISRCRCHAATIFVPAAGAQDARSASCQISRSAD
jgi:hypothetical protein